MAWEWCKTCGEYGNSERHHCPPTWLGWLENNEDLEGYEDEDEFESALREIAIQVHAQTPYGAAEAFAKKLCAQDQEAFELFEMIEAPVIRVRRTIGDPTIHRFKTSGELVQTFYPLKIEDAPAR